MEHVLTGEVLPAEIFYGDGRVKRLDYEVTELDDFMMGRAIDEATDAWLENDSPIGAALIDMRAVDPMQSVTSASAREFRDQDVMSHAEVNVFKIAQQTMGRNYRGNVLYTSAEPCIMCTYLTYRAGIDKIYIAANRADAQGFFRQKDVDMRKILLNAARTIMVVSGLKQEVSSTLLTVDKRRR